ncbi:hypothetical protein F0U59_23495 [Archangium gephyra]|nr:hypothetical protein F0U59_23495 [Archangium gephyra]
MTSNPTSRPITTPTFGRVGYDAYGNHPSAHGPWTTFDGRPMPTWEEYSAAGPGSAGAFTQERWEESAKAIIAEHERRKLASGDGSTRTFEKVAVVITPASQQLQVVGVWTNRYGQRQWVVLSSDTIGGAMVNNILDAYESWKDWAPSGRPVVVLETATGGALLEPMMAELQKEDPAMQIVMVRGCWWCGAGLECPAGCRRQPGKEQSDKLMTKIEEPSRPQEMTASLTMTAWTPESGVALVNFAQTRATGVPLVDTISINEGRVDPFLLGISDIASATRDLAEAARVAYDIKHTALIVLTSNVAQALDSRVSALASPPAEPDSQA